MADAISDDVDTTHSAVRKLSNEGNSTASKPPHKSTQVRQDNAPAPSSARQNGTFGVEVPLTDIYPSWLLNTGYLFALLFAAGCLLASGYYLTTFMGATNQSIGELVPKDPSKVTTDGLKSLELAVSARIIMAHFTLFSCGIFVGVALACLGFALFLIGAKGETQLAAKYDKGSLDLSRLYPGTLIMLSAVVLIGICVCQRAPFEYTRTSAKSSTPNSGRSAGGASGANTTPKAGTVKGNTSEANTTGSAETSTEDPTLGGGDKPE